MMYRYVLVHNIWHTNTHASRKGIIHEIIYYYLMYTIDDKDIILSLCAGNIGQQW